MLSNRQTTHPCGNWRRKQWTHKTRAAFEADRGRDAELVAAGYRVLRFTSRRIKDDPRGVAEDLRRVLMS